MSLTATSCATLKAPTLANMCVYDGSFKLAGVRFKTSDNSVSLLSQKISSWSGADGTSICYAKGGKLYRLTGDTWVASPFPAGHYGGSLWSDGAHIYSSEGSDHWVLNEETGEWEEKAWNGFTEFDSSDGSGMGCIWTDGTNIYYSHGDNQYVLNGDTWEEKTWNIDSTYLYATAIWTDGTNIYCSRICSTTISSDGVKLNAKQFILNKETDTWEEKTWNGMADFGGGDVWTDGTNIYCSYELGENCHHYILNGDTWEEISADLPVEFSGCDVFTDGNVLYVSPDNSANYVFLSATAQLYSRANGAWVKLGSIA